MKKCNVSLNKPIDLMFLLVSPSCHLKRSNIYGRGEGEGVEYLGIAKRVMSY